MAIVPDTKDWTWVLDRPCPECGFDARTVAATEVAGRLRANAAEWVSALARNHVGRRPSPDRWSVLEYACHVRDVFVIYLERLDLMLVDDDPLFANWDQDATAVERRYDEQEAVTVAAELAAAGTALADRFDDVNEAGWHRQGRRSDGASFTVASFSRYLLHDVVHHIWDVGRSR